jgi:hypothetical protein
VTELTEQVRALRESGLSPKEIARALGARPTEVTAIVRALAAEASSGEPAVVGTWISHGWSAGLTVDDRPAWSDAARDDPEQRGLAIAAVARRHRPQRVSVCGYLIDTYCLGVKNAVGPRIMNDRDLPSFLDTFFGAIQEGEPPLQVPLELARHLVCGAVDYARGLGFEPHPDYAATAAHLGAWEGASAITFGCNGTPMYVSGPHDNPRSVIRTLTRTVGEGNFDYLVPMVP